MPMKSMKIFTSSGCVTIDTKLLKITKVPNRDIVYFKLATRLPMRSVRHFFNEAETNATCPLDALLLIRTDQLASCAISPQRISKPITMRVHELAVSITDTFMSKTATCPGDSGAIYFDLNSNKIVAIHSAASPNGTYASFVHKNEIPQTPEAQSNNVFGFLTDKSVSFDMAPNAFVVGELTHASHIGSKSKYCPSVLHKHPDLPAPTKRPSVMRAENPSPLKLNCDKMLLQDDIYITAEEESALVHSLLNALPPCNLKQLPTMEQCILGIPGKIEKLAKDTSSGYPYTTRGRSPKTKLSESDWATIIHNAENIVKDAENGISPLEIYETYLKDELRENEKVDAHKTRIVNASPTALTLAMKHLLGPLLSSMHSNCNTTPFKVGINPHGVEWKVLFDSLSQNPLENTMEMDFSQYEFKHLPFAFRIVAKALFLWYKINGFPPATCYAVYTLILACRQGLVTINSVLLFICMLLSGIAITAELNSLLQFVYFNFAFMRMTKRPPSDFLKQVILAIYGDDHLSTVSNEIKAIFNMTLVAKFFETIGMVLTPAANKTGEITDFINLTDATFLKRSFRPQGGLMDAPLKWESIFNSVQYYRKKANIDPKMIQASTIDSALIEMTHYPKEQYEKFSHTMLKAKMDFGIPIEVLPYEEMRERRTHECYRVY